VNSASSLLDSRLPDFVATKLRSYNGIKFLTDYPGLTHKGKSPGYAGVAVEV
jgi:hypothetical protein